MSGWFENTLGTLTGGLIGDTGEQRGSDRLWEAAKFQPFSINSGIGTGRFNGTTGTGRLNPRYSRIANKYRLFGNKMFNQLQGGDFNKLMDTQLGLLRQLARPEETRDIADMQTMLFNKGLLGATSGSLQMGSLLEEQEQSDLRRMLESIGLARDERGRLFDLGSRSYGADIAMQGMPLDMLKLGADIGGTASNANYNAGKPRQEADANADDAAGDFLGNIFSSFEL